MFGFGKRKKIADLVAVDFDELRKRTRIIVIDDHENTFPLELLKREGYAIDYWKKVENLGILERGDYDIIILDMGGVALDWHAADGLGILEHLKQKNPSQIVVAFSGQSFDLSKNKFFRLADDSLSKPVNAAECKSLIDSLIKKKRTPLNYWSLIVEDLKAEGISEKDLAKLEDRLVTAIQQKSNAKIEEAVKTYVSRAELAVKIGGIAAKIWALIV